MDWLIVGLGNPGKKYEKTRHNVGFWIIDTFAQQLSAHLFDFKEKFNSHYCVIAQGNVHIGLIKPQTYMNRSGEVVAQWKHFYKIANDKIIIIHDELDFAPGIIRLKKDGGAGGHNGIKSIIDCIGSDFMRIRIGIGKPTSAQVGADYVLSQPTVEEKTLMEQATKQCVAMLNDLIAGQNISQVMNQYHSSQ